MASATNGLLVIDTDVLIDYLRDQPLAASVVSIAELVVGVREGVERQRLDAFVSAFEMLPLEKEAAVQAGLLRRQYGRSCPFAQTRPASQLAIAQWDSHHDQARNGGGSIQPALGVALAGDPALVLQP